MWQKVNPMWMRVGIVKSWPCEWFGKTKSAWADFFVEDIKIRDFIEKTFPRSGITKVIIRKTAKEWEIIVFSSKLWVLMGKDWSRIKDLEAAIKSKFDKWYNYYYSGYPQLQLNDLKFYLIKLLNNYDYSRFGWIDYKLID